MYVRVCACIYACMYACMMFSFRSKVIYTSHKNDLASLSFSLPELLCVLTMFTASTLVTHSVSFHGSKWSQGSVKSMKFVMFSKNEVLSGSCGKVDLVVGIILHMIINRNLLVMV